MFSSNQVLQISCPGEQLQKALEFVLRLHYGSEPNPNRQLSYQVNGPYFAIGWHIEPERGWNRLLFDDPAIELLVAAIKQYLKDYPDNTPDDCDGFTRQGYLIESMKDFAQRYDYGSCPIKRPDYGTIVISSKKLTYDK